MGFISTTDRVCALCGSGKNLELITTKDYSYRTCENEFYFCECECGIFRLINQPLDEEIPKVYPDSYSAYSPSRLGIMAQIRKYNFQTKIKDAIGKRRVDSWLDFGCGAGELAQIVKSLGVQNVYGVDFTENLFPEIRKNGVLCFLAHELSDLDDDSLDVVSMLQVIEHLRDPRHELDVIRSKIKNGGVILIETPSPSGLDFKLGKNQTWGGWHAPRHFYIFPQAQLIRLLEESGFRIVSAKYIPSPYMWIETLNGRITVRGKGPIKSKRLSISSIFLVAVVSFIDYALILLRRPTSNQQIVAVKEKS